MVHFITHSTGFNTHGSLCVAGLNGQVHPSITSTSIWMWHPSPYVLALHGPIELQTAHPYHPPVWIHLRHEFSKLGPPLYSDVLWGCDSWACEHQCYIPSRLMQQYPATPEQHVQVYLCSQLVCFHCCSYPRRAFALSLQMCCEVTVGPMNSCSGPVACPVIPTLCSWPRGCKAGLGAGK